VKHIQHETLTDWQCSACISGHCYYSTCHRFFQTAPPMFWVRKIAFTGPSYLTGEEICQHVCNFSNIEESASNLKYVTLVDASLQQSLFHGSW